MIHHDMCIDFCARDKNRDRISSDSSVLQIPWKRKNIKDNNAL